MKTRLMAALLCLPAGFALAQTGNPFRGGEANDADAALVEELSELTDEAERTNSASAGVISELRDLIRRYSRPWEELIVSDSFEDGNYTQNPRWTVVSGTFEARYGELISRHNPPAANISERPQDFGEAIFGAVIQGLAGVPQAQGDGVPEQAQIQLNAEVPNAFAAAVTLQINNAQRGGFEFGLGRGPSASGYLLSVAPATPGAAETASLLRVSNIGSAVVERVELPSNVTDGQDHTFELTRDSSGEMAILLDGTELARVRDVAIRDEFDRFVFVNSGGEYAIQSVEVYGSEAVF